MCVESWVSVCGVVDQCVWSSGSVCVWSSGSVCVE